MSSPAQVLANKANAQHSTGPVTEEGKARVSSNGLTHGLTAAELNLLPWESAAQFEKYAASIKAQYNPQTPEEERLVYSILQHNWLMQRAITLQDAFLHKSDLTPADQKKIALYMRYQSTHERAYYRAMRELRTVRKEKNAEQIGFASQKRQQEAHEAKIRLANARAEAIEVEIAVEKTGQTPPAGNVHINFSDIQDACAAAIRSLAEETEKKST